MQSVLRRAEMREPSSRRTCTTVTGRSSSTSAAMPAGVAGADVLAATAGPLSAI